MHDLHSRYENALMEIAASLQLSRNIIVALVSLQSWKPFLQHWMRACVMLLDVKKPSNVLDTASKAADDILKVWCLFYVCVSFDFALILNGINNSSCDNSLCSV